MRRAELPLSLAQEGYRICPLSSPGSDRAIQYAAALRLKHRGLWNTGSPACAGDDTEQAERHPEGTAAYVAAVVTPPSTTMVWPVMKVEASEAR
ncbi:hypothetical protein ACVW17_002268 [Bradyrhizobium sp. USDA 4473]